MQPYYIGYGLAAYVLSAAVIYAVLVVVVFAIHTQMPVTFGLAVLRSVLWPAWVLFGVPHGAPLPMD